MKYDDKNSLGGRMKQYYENPFKFKLPERMPVIIRLDGRAFHTLTRKAVKPFDLYFIEMMNATSIALCKESDGCQLAYIQSDEISLLLHNYKRLNTQSWFDNEVQKMSSISAGIASSYFTKLKLQYDVWNGNCESSNIEISINTNFENSKPVQFDARCFVLPEAEVNNYFVWRQKDWERNSIQMLAQSLYSHAELTYKNNSHLQDMCWEKGHNWNDLDTNLKRGRCVIREEATCFTCGGSGIYMPPDSFEQPNYCHICKGLGITYGEWKIDNEIPIFSQDKNYIEKYLAIEED